MGIVVEIDERKTNITKATNWAKKHCPHYITNDGRLVDHEESIYVMYRFYFGDEKEAMLFRLKWA